MSHEKEDAKLKKLGLAPNSSLLENKDLDGEETKMLNEKILPKVSQSIDWFDENSKLRIFRGMITNNKGTEAERIKECIETYSRIVPISLDPLDSEEKLFDVMKSVVGGTDLYGHLVWGERLGDISSLLSLPLDHVKAIRMKMMESVRLLQLKSSEERGERRYKQVFVIDLHDVSVGALMTRPKIREMTTLIMSAANSYFPETMWKCFVINAPFVFRSVYAIVSPFIHPVTKEKIKILGSKYLHEMQQAGIELDAIPHQFGGKFADLKLKDCISKLHKEQQQLSSNVTNKATDTTTPPPE